MADAAQKKTETTAPKSDSAKGPVVVETKNFHQVLEHFDEAGELLDPQNMRFNINCGICCENNLAVVAGEEGNNSNSSEPAVPLARYTVLPGCGHAFCTRCISKWMWCHVLDTKNYRTGPGASSSSSSSEIPSCPSCRELVFCAGKHPVHLFRSHDGRESQQLDIMMIRRYLMDGRMMRRDEPFSDLAERLSNPNIIGIIGLPSIFQEVEARVEAQYRERNEALQRLEAEGRRQQNPRQQISRDLMTDLVRELTVSAMSTVPFFRDLPTVAASAQQINQVIEEAGAQGLDLVQREVMIKEALANCVQVIVTSHYFQEFTRNFQIRRLTGQAADLVDAILDEGANPGNEDEGDDNNDSGDD